MWDLPDVYILFKSNYNEKKKFYKMRIFFNRILEQEVSLLKPCVFTEIWTCLNVHLISLKSKKYNFKS